MMNGLMHFAVSGDGKILRIGTRDMCLRVPTTDVMTDLSTLAEAIIQATLMRIQMSLPTADQKSRKRISVFWLSAKLGGAET